MARLFRLAGAALIAAPAVIAAPALIAAPAVIAAPALALARQAPIAPAPAQQAPIAPALPRQVPIAPLRAPDMQMRVLSMQNQSGQVITSAEAQMTDGKTRVLTYAPVQPNQAREIVVPRQECLESLTVHLNNGRTLQSARMHDCKAPGIFVKASSISTKGPNLLPRGLLKHG